MSMFSKKTDMSPNTVHATRVDGANNVVEEKSSTFDLFKDLVQDDASSSVSCGITAVQPGSYGGKVSFMVTVRCDQKEATINIAGKRAFDKALEFCTDAVDLLGWNK